MTLTASGADAPHLDTSDPDFSFEDPAVISAQERSWYATTPRGLLVLRYQEVSDILRDRRFVKGPERYLAWQGVTGGPLHDWWLRMLPSRAPADHTRLRGLVNKAFSPRQVAGLQPAMRGWARQLVDQIAAGPVAQGGTCEFVSAFADPYPAMVMCSLLGVPPEDYETFHRCSVGIGLAYSRDLSADLPQIEAALAALSEYVTGLIATHRQRPGDDLLSALIQVEQDGERITPGELHDLVLLLVWAGQDTTARQLGRAMLAFADHPDQWRLLARQPELADSAVAEVCRWSPQSRSAVRFAAEDVALQGLAIPAGTMVTLCIPAANRDPRVFDDPQRFDITAARSARELAFGAGIHYCLGTNLAHLELAEALQELAARLQPPQLAGPVTWRPPAALIQGPDVLPLRF